MCMKLLVQSLGPIFETKNRPIVRKDNVSVRLKLNSSSIACRVLSRPQVIASDCKMGR